MKDMKMESKSSGHHSESNRELFISSSADGGKTFSPNARVATDVCPCCKTSLAIAKDGRMYLSWRQVLPGDYRHIAVASSTDGGKSFLKPVIVSDDQWMIRGCPVSGAALAADSTGKLRVLWYAAGEKGEHGVYWSESHDGGQTFSSRELVATTGATGTPVLVQGSDGSAGAIWEARENGTAQVLAARFDAVEAHSNRAASINVVTAGAGELPVAVETKDRLFIAKITEERDQRNIWLLNARK